MKHFKLQIEKETLPLRDFNGCIGRWRDDFQKAATIFFRPCVQAYTRIIRRNTFLKPVYIRSSEIAIKRKESFNFFTALKNLIIYIYATTTLWKKSQFCLTNNIFFEGGSKIFFVASSSPGPPIS